MFPRVSGYKRKSDITEVKVYSTHTNRTIKCRLCVKIVMSKP